MADKNITIYDIAEEAGVSPATVSRVLTGNANVSPVKRTAVEALIRKYRFKPNAFARSLIVTRSKLLGILVADIRNPYYSSLVVECEKCAYALGYSVIVCNALSDKDLERSNLEKLYEQRVDGIIQIGCSVDDFMSDPEYVASVNRISRRMPFVIMGKLDGANCYRINIDDNAAMDEIFEYLVSLGHRDIAFVGGKRTVASTYNKYQRFVFLMNRHNLDFREEYLIEGDYSAEQGYESAQKLLRLNHLPTAVIAVNDFTAMGIIKALYETGYKTPDDISLVSYDNTYLANLTTPKLDSVDYNYEALGGRLVQTVLDALNGKPVKQVEKLRPKLIIRGSCGPAKSKPDRNLPAPE